METTPSRSLARRSFWFSIRGKLFKGTALKVFPLPELFEICQGESLQETWTLLKMEHKADNLIRTVPFPKCPHKELFVNLSCYDYWKCATSRKRPRKGRPIKAGLSVAEMAPPLRAWKESTQIYLNVLVEAQAMTRELQK